MDNEFLFNLSTLLHSSWEAEVTQYLKELHESRGVVYPIRKEEDAKRLLDDTALISKPWYHNQDFAFF